MDLSRLEKKMLLRTLAWLALVVAYGCGVAAAWTGTKTDTAASLAITAVLTFILSGVVALVQMD